MLGLNAVLAPKCDENRTYLAATLAVFRQMWMNFTISLTLHPIVWLRFGVDKARSHLHMGCMAQFVTYIENILNIG